MARPGEPRVRLVGIHKRFPGVHALRGASIDLRAGEVHALVGENGAGKSTLIKVLTGAHAPDEGRLEVARDTDGSSPAAESPPAPCRPAVFHGPADAARAGVAAIYQEFNLVPAMTVRENLFLGREPSRLGWVRRWDEELAGCAVLERLGAAIGLEQRLRTLTVAEQQMVEIARALLSQARVLIMDEPTAALTPAEVDRLFGILKGLRERGHAILFITHRLDEVRRIADRITILRDGETIGTWAASEISDEGMIERMIGRPLAAAGGGRSPRAPSRAVPDGSPPAQSPTSLHASPRVPILEACALRGGRVRGVSLSLHAGEILGLAGLAGAGRTELARLLFGADPADGGVIRIDGRPVRIRSPRDAIGLGIGLLTEDRKAQGLVLGLPARDNFSLPNLPRFSRAGWMAGWIDRRAEDAAFAHFVDALRIRLAGPMQRAAHLSGGNQQKLLVARWLESDSRVLLFDEPTRGVDVGAKAEMHGLIRELARRGKAVLVISSEMPEVLALSDRIVVMREGAIAGEIADVARASQAGVLRLAVGTEAAAAVVGGDAQ